MGTAGKSFLFTRFRGVAGAVLAMAMFATSGAAASAAPDFPRQHMSAPTSAAPSAPAPPPAAVAHGVKGTRVEFVNETGQLLKIGGNTVDVDPQKNRYVVEGKSSTGDDISTTITDASGHQVKFYGHNPVWSEAYLQFDGQKVFRSCNVQGGSLGFKVEFIGGDITVSKPWRVTVYKEGRFAHQFIHHTDQHDGVKGTVTNRTNGVAVVRLGGADLKLEPGQSLLFFDAHYYSWTEGRGTQMRITGEGHSGYEVKATDPDMDFPIVEVSGGGQKDRHSFSEEQSRSYQWDGAVRVNITRCVDGKMDVPYENGYTSDWARFTITIHDA